MNVDIPKQIIKATDGSSETVLDLNTSRVIITGEAAKIAVDQVLSGVEASNREVAPGGARGLSVADFDSHAKLSTSVDSDHTRHTIDPEGNDKIITHLAA